ncbi:serine/threonine protein phosphatase [bacterium]|nr:serine/threonine protein phosphatase [bacterium]
MAKISKSSSDKDLKKLQKNYKIIYDLEIDALDDITSRLENKAEQAITKLTDQYKKLETEIKKAQLAVKKSAKKGKVKTKSKKQTGLVSKLSDIKQKEFNNKFLIPTKDQFLDTIDKFIKVSEKQLKKSTWANEKVTNGSKGFVVKIEVKDTADVVMFTDIHSDVEPLQEFMGKMVAKGWVDENDPFVITKEDLYIVPLGDYIDRGTTGIQALYILMNLFIKNPDKVVLIRGNHESLDTFVNYGFYTKELKKLKLQDIKYLTEIDKAFKYMASAAFFVQKNSDNEKRCYALTHGAQDNSFYPVKSFENKLSVVYESIENEVVANFAWSDIDKNKEVLIMDNIRGSGKIFGKGVFDTYSTTLEEKTGVKLVGLFRGHQQVSFYTINENDFYTEDLKPKFKDSNGIAFIENAYKWDGKAKILLEKFTKNKPFFATLDFFRFALYPGILDSVKTKVPLFTLNLKKDFKNVAITGQMIEQR